jgi:hypothetical protein
VSGRGAAAGAQRFIAFEVMRSRIMLHRIMKFLNRGEELARLDRLADAESGGLAGHSRRGGSRR